jgi:hypothetical protein
MSGTVWRGTPAITSGALESTLGDTRFSRSADRALREVPRVAAVWTFLLEAFAEFEA